MNGKQLTRTSSAESLKLTIPLWLEYLLLFGIGIMAILLHARLRTPLNLPGHHGLEFMAVLMAGRVMSRLPWASTISSLGISFVLLFPWFGFSDPFMGINYMLPGFVVDLLFNLTRNYKRQLLVLSLIAGLAYLTIPVSRLIIHFSTGYPYKSFLKHGYLIPLAGYFVFGLSGGLFGSGVSGKIKKFLSK